MKQKHTQTTGRRLALAGGRLGLLAAGAALILNTTAAPDPRQQLVEADTTFAFKLLRQLGGGQAKGNVFIAPGNISTLLQMVAGGAVGETRAQMDQVLGITGLDAAALGAAQRDLAQTIQGAETNVTLEAANAIWYQAGIELRPEFTAINRADYQAKLAPLSFAEPGAAETINQWVRERTAGRIQSMIHPPLPADTRLLLASAIYFKGTWQHPFDPKLTAPRAFHRADGSPEPLPMMEQSRTFAYQQGADFRAVRLPYAGGRLAMYVLLPNRDSNLDKLRVALDAATWENTVWPRFHQRPGKLVFPRLRLEYGVDLKPTLETMGMTRAFTDQADFSGMARSPLALSEVKHKSFVEVNEQGTEAAAVTTGTMRATAVMRPQAPFEMVVDRPFAFVIADQDTRALLFLGLVSNPAGA